MCSPAVRALFDKQYGNLGYSYGDEPPVPENRPQTVYYPSHVEGMEMVGMSSMNGMSSTNSNSSSGTQGNSSEDMEQPTTSTDGQKTSDSRYRCALTYSYPHRFWTVTGQQTEKISIQDDDSIHLIVSVWDGERGNLPDGYQSDCDDFTRR